MTLGNLHYRVMLEWSSLAQDLVSQECCVVPSFSGASTVKP